MRLLGNFVQGAGNATARGVAHAADVMTDAEHLRHQRVQRRAVTFDFALEFKTFALGEDGNTVLADRPAQQNFVARPGLIRGEFQALRYKTNACRINEEPVSLAL